MEHTAVLAPARAVDQPKPRGGGASLEFRAGGLAVYLQSGCALWLEFSGEEVLLGAQAPAYGFLDLGSVHRRTTRSL